MKQKIAQVAVKYFVAFIALLFISITTNGQNIESLMNQGNAKLEELDKASANKMNELTQEFIAIVEKNDKDFAAKLRKEWKPFKPILALEVPSLPGPDQVPVFGKQGNNNPPPAKRIVPNVVVPEPVKNEIVPQVRAVDKEKATSLTATFQFYGSDVAITYDPMLKSVSSTVLRPENVALLWEKGSTVQYVGLVEQMNAYKQQLGLNDWGYYRLCESFAQKVAPSNPTFLLWFLQLRSGYDVKLGFSGPKPVLMIPSLQEVYGKTFFNIGGVNYYVFGDTEGEVSTVEYKYPGAGRMFDFNLYKAVNLPTIEKERKISFEYGGKKEEFTLKYDQRLVDFYSDYPQTSIAVYFNSSVSEAFKIALLEQLEPVVSKLKDDERIGFLLALTQNSFNYQTDRAQFGKEKFFFPEEVLSYPACDCEDRSVFFSYLVNLLVGKQVIGVEYPGHMATAVELTGSTGKYIEYNQKKYLLADPTYLGAPLGAEMPQFEGKTIKVIPLANNSAIENLKRSIWDKALDYGAYRAGGINDILIDGDVAYLTGFFSGKAFPSPNQLIANDEVRKNFLACFSFDGKVKWATTIINNGASTGLSLNASTDKLFLSGSFSGSLKGKSNNEFEAENDIFLAGLQKSGELEWLKVANIDVEKQSNTLTYMVQSSTSGENVSVSYFNEDNSLADYNFWNKGDELFLTGAINKTVGLENTKVLGDAAEYDIVTVLKKKTDELVSQKYDKAIASLFAVMLTMEGNGKLIKGAQVKEALDKYSPTFKNTCPNIYASIPKINFLKNEQGIITVLTNNQGSFSLDKIKMENNAKIKLIILENGNGMWKMLSGVKVGMAVVWFPLNHVELIPKTGDLIFDYGNDHSTTKMNLQRDIID